MFTKEAIISLLKTIFVKWWSSGGKKLAAEEWAKIDDLVSEKISEIVGPRSFYLITSENGNIWEIKVDNEGVIYSSPIHIKSKVR